ncbi:MAG: hypothetical protein R3C11_14315 [Planctomycetaceae bacterium]
MPSQLVCRSSLLLILMGFCWTGLLSADEKEQEGKQDDTSTRLKVGAPAPKYCAYVASGDASCTEDVKDKLVLLSFVTLKDKHLEETLKTLEEIKVQHLRVPDFQMVTIFIDSFEDFITYCNKRGSRFYSNSRNWALCQNVIYYEEDGYFTHAEISPEKLPRHFIISKEYKLLAVDVPREKLAEQMQGFVEELKQGEEK